MSTETQRSGYSPSLWVPTLYFAEGLPFYAVNMMALIFYSRMGVSNMTITATVSLLGLPWSLKPLWSPFLEMYRTKKFFVVATEFIGGLSLGLLALCLPLPGYFRYSVALRERMPRIDLNTVNFDTGSWELTVSQIEKLAALAESLNRAIDRNPREVFLIEGHTDAVGNDVDNLSLSDRRAESVAIVLTQQFNVPPENLTTQGYGSQYLKIPTPGPERANRRVTVRRITPLLTGQAR